MTQQRSLLDELMHGFGQMGAGVVEYMGSSPKAVQELGPVANAVPNAIWMLGGLAQTGYNAITSNDTGSLMGYARSGIDNANQMMTNLTGQEINDPQNFVDTVLREGALAALPTRVVTGPLGTAARQSPAAFSATKEATKGVAAVLAPGMQARTGTGAALEFGAGVALADVAQEFFDDDTQPQYDYQGLTGRVIDVLQQDQYPAELSTDQLLMQENPSLRLTDDILQAEVQPEDVPSVMNGGLKEQNPDRDAAWWIGAGLVGTLAALFAGSSATRVLANRRQEAIKAASTVFGDSTKLRLDAIEETDMGKWFKGASLHTKQGQQGFWNQMNEMYEMGKTQILDHNNMLRVDVHNALDEGRITRSQYDDMLTQINTLGNNGSISEMVYAFSKSGRLPFSGRKMKMSARQILDEESLLSPEEVRQLNEHLTFETVLHDMNKSSAHSTARTIQGRPTQATQVWGDNSPGKVDGVDYFSKSLMQRAVNAPKSKNVQRLIDGWHDYMQEMARWMHDMDVIDGTQLTEYLNSPYAPLRYSNDVDTTDFFSRRNAINDGVLPGEVEMPVRLIAEYNDRVIRHALHNKFVRDVVELEMNLGYKTNDGKNYIFSRAKPTDDNTITVFAKNKGMNANGLRNGHEKGTMSFRVNDPIRYQVLRDAPMMHHQFVQGMDAWRRFSQQLTTGIFAPWFAKISAAYEAGTAFMLHPKGRNTGVGGKILSELANGKVWDAIPDPTVALNPLTGTMESLWADMLETGLMRLRTAGDMGSDMQGALTTQAFGDTIGKMTARPLDRAIVKMLGPQNVDRLHQVMERAYLNSSKHIKEYLGGGTAAIYGDNVKDIPDLMKDLSPSWARQSGALGYTDITRAPGFGFLKSIHDAIHMSTRVQFVNSNKGVVVRKAKINGSELPVVGHPGVIGYSPEMHHLISDARNLTGNVMQRGGIPGTALGQAFSAYRDSIPYFNVGIQVVARTLEQFKKRPLFMMQALTMAGTGYMTYVSSQIFGNEKREQAWARDMGPSMRSAAVPFFNDKDEIIGYWEIPHEMRMFISPLLEAQLASVGLSADTDNQIPLHTDLIKAAWKRFNQDVQPDLVPQIPTALFSAITGQRAPEIVQGRMSVPAQERPDYFETDMDEAMNTIRLITDEMLMGASQMFVGTMQALDAATSRGDVATDWARLGNDVSKSLSYNLRKEKNITAPALFPEAFGNRTEIVDEVSDMPISLFDDQYAETYHNTRDTIKNWTDRFKDRMLNQGVFGGQDGYGRDEAQMRDPYGNAIRLGLMSQEQAALAANIDVLFNKNPRIDDLQQRLTNLKREKEKRKKQYSDPVTRRNMVNVIERQRKVLYAEAVVEIRRIEQQLRQIHPEFKTFDLLEAFPTTKDFDKEGAGLLFNGVPDEYIKHKSSGKPFMSPLN